MRSLWLALGAAALGSACFDFSLPEDGSSTSTTSGIGGSGGAASDGGSGGDAGAGPGVGGGTCEQRPCEACVACVIDFYMGDVEDCQAYDDCVVACGGNNVCEAGCSGTHPGGLFLRNTIDGRCTDACGGPPPC